MVLACNVLNAIGGQPVVDEPRFVPGYPGRLPGSVEAGLVVGLAKLSHGLVENSFMVIESPEDPHEYPVRLAMGAAPETRITIGQFYGRIKVAIEEQNAKKSIFTGAPARQVSHHFAYSEVVPVLGLDDAMRVIDLIVDQGEGTSRSPLEYPGGALAHYFRFSEIVKGKELIADSTAPGGYSYSGPDIPFDPAKVLPVIDNPKVSGYPLGSAARRACQTFNYTYTNLLKVLHEVFNGTPPRVPAAIGLMES